MMKTSRYLMLAALLCGSNVQSDEVTEQIDAARGAYESGELRNALQTLQFAEAKIQEQITDRVLTLLPDPLDGWEAEAATSESGGMMAAMIAGTAISRRYFKQEGPEVEMRIMADSPLISMMTMMLSAPMMMQADPNSRVYSHGRNRGMIKNDKESREVEITLMVGSRILIQVTGRNGADQEAVEAYLKALDIDKIEKGLLG